MINKIKFSYKLFSNRKVNKYFYTIIFFILFMISGCEDTGCIERVAADNFVRTQNSTISVTANGNYDKGIINPSNTTPPVYGQWKDTGISVSKNDTVNLETSGIVYMCMDPWTPITNTKADSMSIYSINSASRGWNITNNSGKQITLNSGDKLYIEINANPNANNDPTGNKWSTWNGRKDPTNMPRPPDWYNDRTDNRVCSSENVALTKDNPCWFTKGQNLRLNILSSGNIRRPIPDTPGSVSLDLSLYPSNPITYQVPTSGTLGFGIYDKGRDQESYDDNIGGYTISVIPYKCPAENGIKNVHSNSGGLIAAISNEEPNPANLALLPNINGSNTANKSGNIWVKVDSQDYRYNIGEYRVEVTRTSHISSTGYSDIVGKILQVVQTNVIEASINIYKNVTCSNLDSNASCRNYLNITRAMLVLYIILYAICFTMGLVQINQVDLVSRVFKIGVILALTSNGSWDFFYTNFFRLFGVVDKTIDSDSNFSGSIYYLIDIMTGGDGSANKPFLFVDYAMHKMILDPDVFFRISGYATMTFVGFIYFMVIIYAIFTFLKVVFEITIAFIISFIYLAILVILAPIFIPCVLFSLTKGIYDNWLRYMFRHSIEPVLQVVGLNIIVSLMMFAVGAIFNESVCVKCAIDLKLAFLISWAGYDPDALGDLSFYCINAYQPWGYDNFGGGFVAMYYLFKKLPYIVFLCAIIKLLGGYRDFIGTFLEFATDTRGQTYLDKTSGGGGNDAVGSIKDSLTSGVAEKAKSAVGLDRQSRQRRGNRLGIEKYKNKALAKNKPGG